MARAALNAMKQYSAAEDGTERHPRLVEQYGRRAEMAARILEAHGELTDKRHDHYAAILIANRSARLEVLTLHRTGKIHDSVLIKLEAELDLEEVSARTSMTEPKFV